MTKKLVSASIMMAVLSIMPSCDKNSTDIPDPLPEPEPGDMVTPGDRGVDLSKDEMANCYVVQAPGAYVFAADNQFNLGDGLPVPPKINPAAASLLWQTEPGVITSVTLEEIEGLPFVRFEVNNPKGSALIAVCNSAGEIEWSWHIWMPEEEIYSIMSSSGYEVMNMNLGALNNSPGQASSYGMLYQWGRKDPFPASATETGTTATVSAPMYDMEGNNISIGNSSWYDLEANTMTYSIQHPAICLSNYSQYASSRDWLRAEESDDSLWGNPDGGYRDPDKNEYINKGRKTCYDPSPAGWRVPPCDVFRHFTTSGGYAWEIVDFNVADYNKDHEVTFDDYDYGWHFFVNEENAVYFPAASRFDGSYAMLMGSMSGLWGNYWSNAPSSEIAGGAFCALAFQVKDQNGNDMVTVSPAAAGSRADAYSIRCIRDIK